MTALLGRATEVVATETETVLAVNVATLLLSCDATLETIETGRVDAEAKPAELRMLLT